MSINFYLTVAGLAAATTAGSNNVMIGITHLVLGAGQYTPATNVDGHATQTALVDRREKTTLGNGTKPTPTQLTLAGLFPTYTAGAAYNAGEIGAYLGDPDAGGILLAVYSAPGYVHAYRNDQLELAESWALNLSAGLVAVTVIVDPTAASAAYMRKDANLGDVASKSASRNNLEVYSKTESDNFFTSPMEVDSAIAAALNFNRNLASTGYYLLPGGLKINWGTSISNSDDSQTFAFDSAYTTALFGVFLQERGLDNQDHLLVSASTLTGFSVDRDVGIDNALTFHWFAIGV